MKVTSLLILLLCFFTSSITFSQNNYEVLLHTGNQIFPENARDYADEATLSANEIVDNHYFRLLQFYTIPNANELKQLEQEGIILLDYIPNKTYVAALPSDFDLEKLDDLNVRSIQSLSPNLKMDGKLQSEYLPDWATEGDQVEVMIKYHHNLRHDDILAFCSADDIDVLEENGYNNFLLAAISQNKIEETAALPYVAFLELRPAPDVKDDTEGRSLHRSSSIDTNFPSGRSYNGEGIAILCRDDGNVGPHLDWHGRLFQTNSLGLNQTHGDGVSGIMAGAGNLDPRHEGMATGADLWVIDYTAAFLDETMDLFFDEDVLVTNSSYSNGCNEGYTSSAQTVDQQIWNNPTLLHVFSAGNSNNNDCDYGAGDQWGNITGGHKQGKNVIATANLFDDGSLVNSSSRGPAHDGRIKPDIAAHGQGQVSTGEFFEYINFGGTSAAAPGIAGITAQLHQAYAETNNGETANSGLLKAILLNTANDLGNKGPDFRYGWGHVNAYRAALSIENETYLLDTVEMNMSNIHSIEVPENVAEVRIMTYWRDRQGAPFATKALVNDLNTFVTDPFGEEHQPWLLDPTPDPTALNNPATTGVDDLNNMEQIAIENPAAGTYSVNVEGFELPFGEHGYFVVWEFRMKEITVIYPIGGERLVPNETQRIHWDAEGTEGTFVLEYSKDNGTSWENIVSVNGSNRMANWQVPNDITPEALIRISRDSVMDTSDATFNVAPTPSGVQFLDPPPPNALRVEWNGVTEAVSYDFYLLGEKYMEVITTVDTTFYDIENPDPSEIYWVAVSANFADGTKSRRTISVAGGGSAPQVNFELSSTQPCANETVTFVDNSIVSGTALTYEWVFGQSAIPATASGPGPHDVIYALFSGDKTATLTITSILGTSTAELNFFVNSRPSGNFSYVIGMDGEVAFTADVEGADSFVWEFGNGDTSEEQNPVYTYPEPGEYEVVMTAINECGERVREKTVAIVGVFTTEIFGNLTLDVFPNPSNGQFNLRIENVQAANDLSIELTDLRGVVIENAHFSSQSGTILHSFEQTDLAAGVYFLKVMDGDKMTVTKVVME